MMKTPANKNETNSNSPKPFFNKSKEENFLNPSKEAESPFFTPSVIQPKLSVGQPDDKYEKEADTVADEVVQSINHTESAPQLQTKDNPQSEEEIQKKEELENEEEAVQKPTIENTDPPPNHLVQAKLEGATPTSSNLESQLHDSKGRGNPLDEGVREQMEPAFGADFQDVSIHTDTDAGQMNKDLGAKAFTHGSDIYFNDGMYNPESDDGKHLLAHELTHVVQQGHGQVSQNENGQSQISQKTQPSIQREIEDVQHAELVTFISQPEGTFPHLDVKYLTEPGLMNTQRAIIRSLVRRVQRGNPPLSTSQFLELVMRRESDRGTALIICHNITKALARGQSPINWNNVTRDPLVYTLAGAEYTFEPTDFHIDADPYPGSRASVFYAMFSPSELGTTDPGDWYHFYAIAAVSYYHMSGNLQPDSPDSTAVTQLTGSVVRSVADALRDSAVASSSAYDGWLMANAVSFLEGGIYGTHGQADVNHESNIHIQGASSELAAEGRIPESDWKWYVPTANSINPLELSNFQFHTDMVHRVRTGVTGEFELTIVSGTTPNHWYDTPDSFVLLPGRYSWIIPTRTSTKVDTTTPRWNEVLTTLQHAHLATVVLELIDEDPISNDSITSFSGDLRPAGRISESFTLTSAGSTLVVRVDAVGHIVLGTP